MVKDSVTFCGFSIARDCIQQAQGIRTPGRGKYLDLARSGRQLRRDPGLAFEQDVPATSGAIAVLRGVQIGADIYAVMYEW